jgi:putative endonuclease
VYNVYAIQSMTSKRIYIGHSNNIDARLKYHNSGYVKSTAKDKPWRMVAVEHLESKDEATWLELSLKKSRGKRLKWIKKNHIKS